VDLREPSEFARGHPKGALSLPYSEKGLEDRLGVLLQPGSPVVLLAEAPGQAQSAVLQLQESAFPVVGVVGGSMMAWSDSDLPLEIMAEVSVRQLAGAVPGGDTVVLDVREPIEWEMGHVPGAFLISLGSLRERLHELPLEAGITVICEAGIRSSSAASILQAEGFAGVVNVPEGTGGYRRAGLPLQFSEDDTKHERV
jgi:hydroxyacylglutathione hydrolase